ncbi:hypothetical protein F2Q69_00061317 [Brassica cretica]|uniref:Uncharacterized protein n=1 Tax=Brassica cretica TaxID=69181 RepID=A0A8S9RMM8_BRACR|nr:hypothetical protein F2Q69_00061317 [Brassica cretica]
MEVLRYILISLIPDARSTSDMNHAWLNESGAEEENNLENGANKLFKEVRETFKNIKKSFTKHGHGHYHDHTKPVEPEPITRYLP